MVAGRVFFLALSALIALVGLFTAARSEGYLNFFGFALLAFGVLFRPERGEASLRRGGRSLSPLLEVACQLRLS